MKNILILITILFVSCSSNEKKKKNSIIYDSVLQINEPKEKLINKNIIQTDNVDFENKSIDTIPPKKTLRTLKEYEANIFEVSKKISLNELLTVDDIESVIPITIDEFSLYYELTYPEVNSQKIFDRIDSEIIQKAKQDIGTIFFLYLNIAEFVDGEYADGYSSDVETVVLKNKEKFCIMFRHLSEGSKFRLNSLYKEVCLGIKREDDCC